MDEFRGLRQYILKVAKPNVEVTGAARLYRAASVWTAGLDHEAVAPYLLSLSSKTNPCISIVGFHESKVVALILFVISSFVISADI